MAAITTAPPSTPVQTHPVPGEQRIALYGVDWETYRKLARARDDNHQHVLMAYNRGVLELMSPGAPHERYKKRLDRLIATVTEELAIPCCSLGKTTWDRPEVERGIESDECYFLTAEKVRAVPHYSSDAANFPTPDLAIEIDMSPSKVDRTGIYATLGVAEVWRFDGETLRIDRLQEDGTYRPAAESLFLPVTPAEVVNWLSQAGVNDESPRVRQLREWVRAEVLPRRRPGGLAQGENRE